MSKKVKVLEEVAYRTPDSPSNKPTFHPIDVACGLLVKQARTQQRMSQSKLAEGLGITFQQVQKYERGANRVSVSRLFEIARILGVSPYVLFPLEKRTDIPAEALSDQKLIKHQAEVIADLKSRLESIKSTARGESLLMPVVSEVALLGSGPCKISKQLAAMAAEAVAGGVY